MRPINVEEALQRASFCLKQAGLEDSRVEAEILLSNLLKTDRLQLFLGRTREIPPLVDAAFRKAVSRRTCGEPLAYINGEKYFYGHRFIVNKNVLIPRPETELIIESALEWVRLKRHLIGEPIRCVDLGTGSGILAVTLAIELAESYVWAVDLSAAALKTARQNAAALEVQDRISFAQGSYFEAFENRELKPCFNLIVSNPPYIRKSDLAFLPKEVASYEPVEALCGGEDGLEGYRNILRGLSPFIRTPALLLFEIGAGQQKQVEELCLQTGLFNSVAWRRDLAGHPRVLEGYIKETEDR